MLGPEDAVGDHRHLLLAALFLALLAACNSVPTAPAVQISPAVPTTTDDLTVEIAADATDNGRVLFYRTTWTRDGEQWVRDIEPFFEPGPDPNAWDHAHAWLDWQLPVGDEVYLYYGGYKHGHKMDRWEGRQIGLVKMLRDRYVSRDAGTDGGTLRTPPVILAGNKMTVNAAVADQLRVRLLDEAGRPIPGFDADDCEPIHGDSLTHSAKWKAALSALRDRPVKIEFILHDAQLYALDLAP